ncbi:MAG TPA: twin-arginine translocation signal domain-containing protein [Syntrophales bacterium]|nr:twin-arginine translocation signal domain-containing protein [Syntrophales bacterium]
MQWELSGNRRMFLKGAAIIGGLALLLGRNRPAAAEPEPSLPQKQPSKGYHVTEHVKKYYETARP